MFFQKIYLKNIFIREGFVVLLVIKIVTKKMFSSESEESDSDIEENFDNFLYAKNHKYEWKDLEFDGLDKHLAYIFHDRLIRINEQKIFDLWEHDFDINKNAHICDNLNFHYNYNGNCIPFLLKIENCCMTIRKGNHLKRIKYLEPFSIGISSTLWQVHADFVEKLNELTKKKITPLDFGYIRIDAGHLPIEKVTYFKNLIICYEKMEKVTYKNKEKYALIARVISGEILLPKKDQCYNCKYE